MSDPPDLTIEQQYERLNILDAKSSGLLTFNAAARGAGGRPQAEGRRQAPEQENSSLEGWDGAPPQGMGLRQ